MCVYVCEFGVDIWHKNFYAWGSDGVDYDIYYDDGSMFWNIDAYLLFDQTSHYTVRLSSLKKLFVLGDLGKCCWA